jgi:hypothetical protein
MKQLAYLISVLAILITSCQKPEDQNQHQPDPEPQEKPVPKPIGTYKYDGKALGDHYPVAVTFEVVNVNDPGPSGISSISSATESEGTREYYNTSGQRVSNPKSGLYIERTGRQARKRIVKR